jgi:outer membrane protein assembly factor BamA
MNELCIPILTLHGPRELNPFFLFNIFNSCRVGLGVNISKSDLNILVNICNGTRQYSTSIVRGMQINISANFRKALSASLYTNTQHQQACVAQQVPRRKSTSPSPFPLPVYTDASLLSSREALWFSANVLSQSAGQG